MVALVTKRPAEPTDAVIKRMRDQYVQLMKRYGLRVTLDPLTAEPVMVDANGRDIREAELMRYVTSARKY